MRKNVIIIIIAIIIFIFLNIKTWIINNKLDAERLQGIIETSINNGDQYNIYLIEDSDIIKKEVVKLSESSHKMTIDFFDGSVIDIYYDDKGRINYSEIQ